MSATRESPRNGERARQSWSLDHCEAEVAHLYKVLHHFQSLTGKAEWALFDDRPQERADRDKRPGSASHSRP